MNKSRLLSAVCACALLFVFTPGKAAVLIIDTDVENDGDWTASITGWSTQGFGFLTPGLQEGLVAATMNNNSSISQSFGSMTMQAGTYAVEFAIGNYSNAPFPNVVINFAGLNLNDASGLSQTATPTSGDWELWKVVWDVSVGNSNIGNTLDFALSTPGSATANLAFDGVGSLSSNGSGFLVTYAAVPLPAAAWLFGSGLLGLIGITRRKKTA